MPPVQHTPSNGVEVEALGEHRQQLQQRLLGAVEQRIRPVDGGPQCLLPRQGGAASPGEQAEALVETVAKTDERQRTQPGRSELDGQWQPIQPSADRYQERAGLLVDGQVNALLSDALDEQSDRLTGLRTDVTGARKRQRRHPVNALATDAERLAAGGQQAHPRAAPQDSISRLRACSDQMLAVVQHDQDILQGERIEQALQGGLSCLPAGPEDLGNSRRDLVPV